MAESTSFDVYSDEFRVNINAWGSNLTFLLREEARASDAMAESQSLGKVRMSNEHLKVMAFIIVKVLKSVENETETTYPVPVSVLSQLGISSEEWGVFWDLGG